MTTVTGRVTRVGEMEAIQLPDSIAFGRELEVTIARSGDVLTIYPKRAISTREMLAKLRELPEPGEIEEREPFEPPERPGL